MKDEIEWLGEICPCLAPVVYFLSAGLWVVPGLKQSRYPARNPCTKELSVSRQ